jgi:hypothetical protein
LKGKTMKQPAPGRFVAFLGIALTILTVAFSSDSTFAATPIIPIGQDVFTTGVTNVRATADGTLVGTQPRYSVGTVTTGPVTISGDSVTWYKVTFNTGPSGWVGADMLIDGVVLPKSVVIERAMSQDMILDEFGNIEVAFIVNIDPNFYGFAESTNQGMTFNITNNLLPMHTLSASFPFPDGPTLAAEHNGAIDIVYVCPPSSCPQGGAVQTIELIRSIDHGATWSTPVQISVPPRQTGIGPSNPVIAACGAGVTVAWVDGGVGSKVSDGINPRDLYVMQVVNGVPGTPVNMSYSTLDEQHPQILVNPQGTVYVSWIGVGGVNFAAIPNCAAIQH